MYTQWYTCICLWSKSKSPIAIKNDLAGFLDPNIEINCLSTHSGSIAQYHSSAGSQNEASQGSRRKSARLATD